MLLLTSTLNAARSVPHGVGTLGKGNDACHFASSSGRPYISCSCLMTRVGHYLGVLVVPLRSVMRAVEVPRGVHMVLIVRVPVHFGGLFVCYGESGPCPYVAIELRQRLLGRGLMKACVG